MDQAASTSYPTPGDVTALVRRLITSPWPTTEDERSRWFAEHGIVAEDPVLQRDEHGSRSWTCWGAAAWGRPHSGWHVFQGQFVGVHWFLWHGLTDDVVPGLARELRDGLTEVIGEPLEELDSEGYRFTTYWEVHGRSVDMYLHGGLVLEGTDVEDPVVQLHVDHVERSRRADAAVPRQPVPTT